MANMILRATSLNLFSAFVFVLYLTLVRRSRSFGLAWFLFSQHFLYYS